MNPKTMMNRISMATSTVSQRRNFTRVSLMETASDTNAPAM